MSSQGAACKQSGTTVEWNKGAWQPGTQGKADKEKGIWIAVRRQTRKRIWIAVGSDEQRCSATRCCGRLANCRGSRPRTHAAGMRNAAQRSRFSMVGS